MFAFLLTAATLYDILQEYRRMCCLYSFAVHSSLYRYSSFTREFSADMTAPQRARLCKVFSAKRAAPELSERRATKGFCKRTILHAKPLVVFLRAKTGLFCVTVFYEISRYHLCSEKMCDERLL